MVKKRGPGRPRKRGRPKGSKNKNKITEKMVWSLVDANDGVHTTFEETEQPVRVRLPNDYQITTEVDLKSRLDECMIRFETAIAEAISKIKASI